MGTGPAGVGVLHTSGNAIVTPSLSSLTTESLLTPTLLPMLSSFGAHFEGPDVVRPIAQGQVSAPEEVELAVVSVHDHRIQLRLQRCVLFIAALHPELRRRAARQA